MPSSEPALHAFNTVEVERPNTIHAQGEASLPNLAMKFRRSGKGAPSQKHQQKERARSHKQHDARNQKRRGATNEQSRVAEVTKIQTSKINHEVVNVTRSKTSE